MSQIDPDDYQTEGSSALQDAANKAGKTATKKLAKKAVQSAATKAAAVTGSTIGFPVILGTAAVILILGILVKAVSTQAEMTQKDAAKAVDALFETISNTLAKEEKIQLIGFGTFEVRERSARKGRNPQTGEEIDIAASKVPAFKPGKELKEAVK